MPTEGLTVTFQDLPCSPIFEYPRSIGLEPDSGFVHIERSFFADLVIHEALDGVDVKPGASTVAKGKLRSGLLSASDLAITEVLDDEVHTVTFKNVILTENAVQTVVATDDDSDFCRVEISDIRYLWGKRGIVFAWINVALNAAGQVVDSGPATADVTAGPQALPEFIPGSLRDGRPWTLLEVLQIHILPNLPGRPTLHRIPADLLQAIPQNHTWNGVLTKKALEELLEEFQLVLALNPDSSISLWHADEGELQDADGTAIAVEEEPRDARISWSRGTVGYHYLPAVVLVLGPEIVATARLVLEPVGEFAGRIVPLEAALNAIGIPLAHALRFAAVKHDLRSSTFAISDFGLREFDRWAFKWFRLPGLSGGRADGAAPSPAPTPFSGGFLGAAFDAANAAGIFAAAAKPAPDNTDKLPMLDRGLVDEIGQFLPPRVWSETFGVARAATLLAAPLTDRATPDLVALTNRGDRTALATAASKVQSKAQEDYNAAAARFANAKEGAELSAVRLELAEKREALARETLDRIEASRAGAVDKLNVGTAISENRAIAQLREAESAPAGQAAPGHDLGARPLSQAKPSTDAADAELQGAIEAAAAAGTSRQHAKKALDAANALVAVFNIPLCEQNDGYEIDRKHGVVKFGSIQGHVLKPAVDLDTAELSPDLATVIVEFGYARKPTRTSPLLIANRYHSAYSLDTKPGADAKVIRLEELPLGATPLVIDVPHFQQVDGPGGESNKGLLDNFAAKLASDVLKKPAQSRGSTIQFHRPLELVNTGAVRSIVWKTESSSQGKLVPRVFAHVGTWHPLAPLHVQTNARTARGGRIFDSVLVPHSQQARGG